MSREKNIDWVVGINSVNTLLSTDPSVILSLYISKDHKDGDKKNVGKRVKDILALAMRSSLAVEYHNKNGFDGKFDQYGAHQGVAARVKAKPVLRDKDFEVWLKGCVDKCLILILDQVKDPHNLGAILRTADAVGVDAVIVPDKHSSPITPVVQKVASGAVASINVYRVNNLARTIEKIKRENIWVVGTSDQAKTSLYDFAADRRQAVILGAEGEGMRRLTTELCDQLIYIPMSGVVSSLNVSVAAGVVLYEVSRIK